MTRYFGEFAGIDDLRHEFKISLADVQDPEILWAYYEVEGYGSTARVIYQREGHVYEVYGSHCSCMGLEDQWEPAEVSWGQLAMRPAEAQASGNAEAIAAWTEMVNQHVPRA